MNSKSTSKSGQSVHNCVKTIQALNTRLGQPPNLAKRAKRWQFNAAGLALDMRRSAISDESLSEVLSLAKDRQIAQKIAGLIAGEPVNNTEQRAAHHSALRAIFDDSLSVSALEARGVFQRVCELANRIRQQLWHGFSGKPIRDVVNIGIGGSDLGPRLVCAALDDGAAQNSNAPAVHFAANIDPVELNRILRNCQPETTLFIVASKSFSTQETLENAKAARRWLLNSMQKADLAKHLVAISSNVEKATGFGIAAENIFPMWDWVGGRYSLWSAIGLPIAIAHGAEAFEALLRGAHAMDTHFASAPLEENLPVLLAALDFIHINALGAASVAVLPYAHQLALLPDYLQQLCMESNGKGVDRQGNRIDFATGPVVWGSAGTVGQHSFHQLLHQGSEAIPIDFILPLQAPHNAAHAEDARHRQLVANCLAQSKAFAEGKSVATAKQELLGGGASEAEASRLAPHKASPGQRSNIIIAMDSLNAGTLGALLALYEHRVYVQSILWDINAFDQWGVELGKQLGGPIDAALADNNTSPGSDEITNSWIKKYQSLNAK
ncbi:MAG: glucose-6-phosphate isomerase [Gammaproteobacteria bacterium]|nr:glucose-6-phosphate isomerase [Gammaproteobacteria bacterium]